MLCLCLLLCTGCVDKAPEYPELEGFWKTERIVDNATGEEQPCHRLYWALQLGIVQLKDLGGNGLGNHFGRFAYDRQAGTLRIFEVQGISEQKLQGFGIPSTDTLFGITLRDGKMVLQSETTTVYFSLF